MDFATSMHDRPYANSEYWLKAKEGRDLWGSPPASSAPCRGNLAGRAVRAGSEASSRPSLPRNSQCGSWRERSKAAPQVWRGPGRARASAPLFGARTAPGPRPERQPSRAESQLQSPRATIRPRPEGCGPFLKLASSMRWRGQKPGEGGGFYSTKPFREEGSQAAFTQCRSVTMVTQSTHAESQLAAASPEDAAPKGLIALITRPGA
ncbi:uncharacterized protein [Symphalangus syndactylus]|uniref:uncharacterized protein n=1 Tax=Symphalangus syndactylus TaxID=9590 RepID=UPI0030057744